MTAFGPSTRFGPTVRFGSLPQPWSPMDLGGLVAWVDILDRRGYTTSSNGLAVSSVQNKATGVWWDTPSAEVPLETYGINGRPCLHPKTLTERILSTEAPVVAAMANGAVYTILWVGTVDTADASGALFSAGNTGSSASNKRHFGQNTSSSGRYISQTINSSATTVNAIGSTQVTLLPTVCSFRSDDGTTVDSWVNGAPDLAGAAQSPGTLTPNQVGLFAIMDSSADTNWVGRFGEMLVFNRALTDAELDEATAYLMVKWGFTPSDLSGLVGWFDMLDATSFSQSGGSVQSIRNKATGILWNTALSVLPGYSATGLSGRPAMSFNGSSQAISSTADSSLISALNGNTSYTLLSAAQITSLAAARVFFGVADSASSSGFKAWGVNSGPWTISGNTTAGASVTVSSAGQANLGVNIYEAYAPTTTTATIRANGALPDPDGDSQNTGALACNRAAIGCRPRSSTDLRWIGTVGEIVVYSRTLSSSERAFVRTYMGSRWAVEVAYT